MSYSTQKNLINKKLERRKLDEIIERHEFIGELIVKHGTSAKGRKELAKKSFFAFCMIYLPHIFRLAPADFHHLLIHELQYPSDDITGVMGFRGSGKSTIASFAFPLWASITGQYEFLLCIYADSDAMTLSIGDMKREVEDNGKLRSDFSIAYQKKVNGITEKWSDNVLTFNKRKNIIVGKTVGQKIRGYKYAGRRPQFILLDDAENPQTSDKIHNRQKFQKYFYGEVVPAKDEKFQIVVVGNLTHRACLLELLAKKGGTVFKFPLIKNGKIQWLARFPDMKAIEREKQMILLGEFGQLIWNREYMLKIIDDENQIIKEEDIKYYDDEMLQRQSLSAGVGVDLAISKKQTADNTAMIKGKEVNNDDGEPVLLVMKNNVVAKLDFEETINKAHEVADTMPKGVKFYVEKVAYQQVAIEVLEKSGLVVEAMTVTTDKRARLMSVSHHIKSGRVKFPKTGCEALIVSLLGFGVESHDDDVDALVHLINGLVKRRGGIIFG